VWQTEGRTDWQNYDKACVYSPVYSDTTKLDVELSCVALYRALKIKNTVLKCSILYCIRIIWYFSSKRSLYRAWDAQVACVTTSSGWSSGVQRQQQQQQQVPVIETVDSSNYQTQSVMYLSSADCSVTRHEDDGPPSTCVTSQWHTSAQLTPSSPAQSSVLKPPPYPTPPTAYKHLSRHRLDVDMTTRCHESSQLDDCCQAVNSNVDVGLRATRSELPGSDVNSRTPSHWTRRKSLSLPTRK